MKKSVILLACIMTLVVTVATGAQQFPVRPIRMIIAESSASGADIIARQIGAKLTEIWDQPVVVDSRTGASGLIAAELVARAAPDGYTIWLATMTQLISTTLYQRYRMADEFLPVGRVARTYFVIAANASVPVNSIAELIAYAKARPGQILYGSTGQGSSTHLCMELFRAMTGLDLVHVPYKSAAIRLADLAGGQLHASCAVAPSLQAFVRGGRVRALGVTAATRTALVPGVPAIAETVPGYEIVGWYGLLAPKGTPPELVAQINAALVKVLKAPEVQERLNTLGAEAAGSTPAEFGIFLRNQTNLWAKVLRDANIRPAE